MATSPKHRQLKRTVESSSDTRRISASEAGYDHYWTSVVAPAIRERDGWMCQECLREGGLAQATDEILSRPIVTCQECRGRKRSCGLCNGTGKHARQPPVDHKKPGHVCTPDEFYDPANLQVLCEAHNQKKRHKDEQRYGSAKR